MHGPPGEREEDTVDVWSMHNRHIEDTYAQCVRHMYKRRQCEWADASSREDQSSCESRARAHVAWLSLRMDPSVQRRIAKRDLLIALRGLATSVQALRSSRVSTSRQAIFA